MPTIHLVRNHKNDSELIAECEVIGSRIKEYENSRSIFYSFISKSAFR